MSNQLHKIRDEVPGDEEGIGLVLASAFPTSLESQLVSRLRASGRLRISLVAPLGEQIVGHVAFSPVTVAASEGGLGLAPLSVLSEYQRQGIGSSLVRAGLAACRRLGAPFVVVLGEPHYYSRFGFVPAARWGLVDEYGGGDAFAAIEFNPGGIPPGGGLVRYAPEFSLFSE